MPAVDSADGRYVHEMIDVGVDFDRASVAGAPHHAVVFDRRPSVLRESGGPRRVPLERRRRRCRQRFRPHLATRRLRANRGTEFIPGFVEPVFSDTVGGLSVAGMLAKRRRVDGDVGARHAAESGFDGTPAVRHATAAIAQLNVGADAARSGSTASTCLPLRTCRPARPSSTCSVALSRQQRLGRHRRLAPDLQTR